MNLKTLRNPAYPGRQNPAYPSVSQHILHILA